MTRITFKSTPENYEKEKSGMKSNTFRRIDENDIRFITLRNGCTFIEIMNSDTFRSFTREITDYTEYNGYGIISWKHIE